MEISEIQKAHSVQKIKKNEALASTQKMEDSIHISVEAAKKAKWVEMLKEMPEIRLEKIQNYSFPAHIDSLLAEKLMSEII